MITTEKIEAFRSLLQKQQIERLKKDNLDCQTNIDNSVTYIKPGRKYTKVDVGGSGKYMVVNETGEIFGIKAYGVIHRGHKYGTLDTINDFYWGYYKAYRLSQSSKR